MDMIPVSSKAIRAIGYDPATQRMKISFRQGHAYDFCRVPQQAFDAFMRAGFKERYLYICP
jgi:hypothetical protein